MYGILKSFHVAELEYPGGTEVLKGCTGGDFRATQPRDGFLERE